MRFIVSLLILLCGVLPPCAAQGAALERGTAITDPYGLRELDRRTDLGSAAWFVRPRSSVDVPLTNDELFALPSMAPVRKALDDEFDRYVARHQGRSAERNHRRRHVV